MGKFVVKLKFKDDVRRFNYDDTPTLYDITKTSKELYGVQQPSFKYEDEEKDLVSVASDSELSDALELANGKILLFISEQGHKTDNINCNNSYNQKNNSGLSPLYAGEQEIITEVSESVYRLFLNEFEDCLYIIDDHGTKKVSLDGTWTTSVVDSTVFPSHKEIPVVDSKIGTMYYLVYSDTPSSLSGHIETVTPYGKQILGPPSKRIRVESVNSTFAGMVFLAKKRILVLSFGAKIFEVSLDGESVEINPVFEVVYGSKFGAIADYGDSSSIFILKSIDTEWVLHKLSLDNGVLEPITKIYDCTGTILYAHKKSKSLFCISQGHICRVGYLPKNPPPLSFDLTDSDVKLPKLQPGESVPLLDGVVYFQYSPLDNHLYSYSHKISLNGKNRSRIASSTWAHKFVISKYDQCIYAITSRDMKTVSRISLVDGTEKVFFVSNHNKPITSLLVDNDGRLYAALTDFIFYITPEGMGEVSGWSEKVEEWTFVEPQKVALIYTGYSNKREMYVIHSLDLQTGEKKIVLQSPNRLGELVATSDGSVFIEQHKYINSTHNYTNTITRYSLANGRLTSEAQIFTESNQQVLSNLVACEKFKSLFVCHRDKAVVRIGY